MSRHFEISIGGGHRPVERIEERIIVSPRHEIIEEVVTRGPYVEETIIRGPRREIIEERVVVGPGRREVIEERIIVDRPADSYRRSDAPPPYSESDNLTFIGNPVLPVKVSMPKPTSSVSMSMPKPISSISMSMPKPISSVSAVMQAKPFGLPIKIAGSVTPGKVLSSTSSYSAPLAVRKPKDHMYGWVPPSHCRGTITWVECYNGEVPSDPVHAGVDKDGSPIYAGRAWHEGDLLPAKICPSHRCAYVSWGGNEIRKDRYEVMCSRHVAWQYDSDGRVPAEAIVCGHTSGGERLYMGRCMHDGTMTVGKIHPSHHCLYIPYAGREISHKQYEVLVLC